jgi:lysophospholipase L1-like esterase
MGGTEAGAAFIERDTRLGWRAKANYQYRYRIEDANHKGQMITYSSVAGGFRLFGNAKSTGPKLLVIGDSFTQATSVSTADTYQALLGKALDVRVYSYGASGFGTLQELMVLEDVIEQIDPDIVLLQFCTNDFINNSFRLESKSTLNNNRMVRPYLTAGGTVYYGNPTQNPTLTALMERSQLVQLLVRRLFAHRGESIEYVIGRDPGNQDFQASVSATRVLLQRFRGVVGKKRTMFIFLADGAPTRVRTLPPEYQAYSAVAEKAVMGILASLPITIIGGIPEAVAEADARGLAVTGADGAHWNEIGHRTVASALSERLRPYLKDRRSPHVSVR